MYVNFVKCIATTIPILYIPTFLRNIFINNQNPSQNIDRLLILNYVPTYMYVRALKLLTVARNVRLLRHVFRQKINK